MHCKPNSHPCRASLIFLLVSLKVLKLTCCNFWLFSCFEFMLFLCFFFFFWGAGGVITLAPWASSLPPSLRTVDKMFLVYDCNRLLMVTQSLEPTGQLGFYGFPLHCTPTLPCLCLGNFFTLFLCSTSGWEADGTVNVTCFRGRPSNVFYFICFSHVWLLLMFSKCCEGMNGQSSTDLLRINNIDDNNGNNPHCQHEVFSSSLVSCHWTTRKECFKEKKTHYICIFLYPDAI